MRESYVRTIVEGALDRIVAGERADHVLDRALRGHRDLTSDERRHVAERTLGIALWRGRLDALSGGDRTLWYPLFLVDREGLQPSERIEEIRRAQATPEPADPVDALCLRRSLPRWLAVRWLAQFGPAADALAAATNERGPVCIRANRLHTDRDTLRERLEKEGVSARNSALAPNGLVLAGRPNVHGLRSWRDGWFEVQDEASQLVTESLGAKPGERVVDLCAGSGGKTLAIAADLGNSGRIVAIDLDPRRLRDLDVRLRRAGVTCVETRAGDATDPHVSSDLEGVDAVLVDGPCSELGVLRRSPDARWRLAPDAPDAFAPLQRALLARAALLVRPGGRVVYATCSVDQAENEAISHHPPPSLRLDSERTLRPDTDGCDGFHIARFTAA